MLLAVAGCAVALVTAFRALPNGLTHERAAMHLLTGSTPGFDTIAWVLARLPLVTVLVCVGLLGLVWRRSWRADAVGALTLVVASNVTAQLLKTAVGVLLPAGRDTLPSGHACLALSVGCALAFVTRGRWAVAARALAAAVATFGALGVIAAYWHVPGDVIASLAVVSAWVAVIRFAVRSGIGSSRIGARPAHERATFSTRLRDTLSGGFGVVVLLMGWGTGVNRADAAHAVAGCTELCLVPLAVGTLVAVCAGGLPGPERPTH